MNKLNKISNGMKKLLLLSLTFSFLPSEVFAESSIKVKVSSDVSLSSDSTINSNTNIRIEENGKVTTYSSDKPENVEVNSVNGVSEIKVNGETVSQENSSPNPTKVNNQEEKSEDITQRKRFNIVVEIINQGISVIKLIFSFF